MNVPLERKNKRARKQKLGSQKKLSIAILQLGSFVATPKGMKTAGKWNEDGPCLPVEFARMLKNGGLTLVLHPDVLDAQVLWAQTKLGTLREAIAALAEREETKEDNIGFYSKSGNSSRCNVAPEILPRIIEWAKEHQLDAVVWADLPSNFKEEMHRLLQEQKKAALTEGIDEEDLRGRYAESKTDFSEANVLLYLDGLNSSTLLKTPHQHSVALLKPCE